MNPYYNQNYTREEIDRILMRIKDCVINRHFVISLNGRRQDNIDFINEYNIRSDRQREILLGIKTEDFCHSLNNIKPGYEHEQLYVFVPQVKLYDAFGEEEMVDIYTKFNIVERQGGARTVVISFHRRNKPIEYLFR